MGIKNTQQKRRMKTIHHYFLTQKTAQNYYTRHLEIFNFSLLCLCLFFIAWK